MLPSFRDSPTPHPARSAGGFGRRATALKMSAAPESGPVEESRRGFVQTSVAGAAALTAATLMPEAALAAKSTAWRQVDLGISETLYDISFDPAEKTHGYVVGAKVRRRRGGRRRRRPPRPQVFQGAPAALAEPRVSPRRLATVGTAPHPLPNPSPPLPSRTQGTFLETKNGGKSWTPRSFSNLDADEEINYRFEKVGRRTRPGRSRGLAGGHSGRIPREPAEDPPTDPPASTHYTPAPTHLPTAYRSRASTTRCGSSASRPSSSTRRTRERTGSACRSRPSFRESQTASSRSARARPR